MKRTSENIKKPFTSLGVLLSASTFEVVASETVTVKLLCLETWTQASVDSFT